MRSPGGFGTNFRWQFMIDQSIPHVINNYLGILEQHFGRTWLNGSTGKKTSSSKKRVHPVREIWKEGGHLLEAVRRRRFGQQDVDNFLELADLAGIFAVVGRLENFRECVLPRLRDAAALDEFAPALYECRIAAKHAAAGHTTKFIPTRSAEAIRTADIGVEFDGLIFPLECKQKARITSSPLSPALRGAIGSHGALFLNQFEQNFDLDLFVIGSADEAALPAILPEISEFIEAGGRGEACVPDKGFFFEIRDRQPPPAGPIKDLHALPGDIRFGAEAFTMSFSMESLEGKWFLVRDWRTARTLYLDTHRVNAIKNTLNQGRQQIPDDRTGAIYIALDSSLINEPSADAYLRLMSNALSRICWAGGDNSRIGAIVLSAGPFSSGFVSDVWGRLERRWHYFTVCQPNPSPERQAEIALLERLLRRSSA